MSFCIGQGFDVHAFAEGRRLVLGGVEIPHGLGLAGHSDADVLVHAVCDAVLGAAGLGDIGRHFPDTDTRFKDADSLELLSKIAAIVREKGLSVINVDGTVMAEAPRLAPYTDDMRKRLANCLGIRADRVNVKATTTEGMGFTGRREGIAAMAVALLTEEC